MDKIKCECGTDIAVTVDDHHGPTIGICGHTGASWETLLSVLCGTDFEWNVIAYLRTGVRIEGNARFRSDDILELIIPDRMLPTGVPAEDSDQWGIEINMEDVLHIQIT